MLKISGFLAGALAAAENDPEKVIKVGIADVEKVFDTARSAISGSKLNPNLQADFTSTLNDAEVSLSGLAGIAGTELGTIVADSVDEVTNIFVSLTGQVAGTKAAALYSPAEKAAVQQGATALISQLQTLTTQIQAGITPAAPATQAQQQAA